jgi:hypothetical protein
VLGKKKERNNIERNLFFFLDCLSGGHWGVKVSPFLSLPPHVRPCSTLDNIRQQQQLPFSFSETFYYYYFHQIFL